MMKRQKDQGYKPEKGRIGREKSAVWEHIYEGSATKILVPKC